MSGWWRAEFRSELSILPRGCAARWRGHHRRGPGRQSPRVILSADLDQTLSGARVNRLKVGSKQGFSTSIQKPLVADLRRLLAPQCIARALDRHPVDQTRRKRRRRRRPCGKFRPTQACLAGRRSRVNGMIGAGRLWQIASACRSLGRPQSRRPAHGVSPTMPVNNAHLAGAYLIWSRARLVVGAAGNRIRMVCPRMPADYTSRSV
jgi:hypothetical protein